MLILASASKPRSYLLKKAGISHKIIISDVNENDFYKKNINDLVATLSYAKGENVVSKIIGSSNDGNYFDKVSAVLACDSLFEFEGEYFGKSINPNQAFERLKRMSSSYGFLKTGHSLFSRDLSSTSKQFPKFNRIFKDVISTKVFFNQMTEKDIWSYIDTKEPLKTAGGFALEGYGSMFVSRIEGCYSNVIGLSLPWLRNILKEINLL